MKKKLLEANAANKEPPATPGYPAFTSKRMGPICMVWGQVGGPAGQTVGKVNDECRPSQKLIFHASSNNRLAYITIDTAGAVTVEASGPIAPKYPSTDQLDSMIAGNGANVWIQPMAAGPTNYSALQNKTGRYPMVRKGDPPLAKKMSREAGKPTGVAPKESQLELVKKAMKEKKALAVNSSSSVIRSDFELLEVQEEGGKTKTISISLSGIVYAVADHHSYVRTKRKTLYHGKKLKEIQAKKAAKPPPKLSDCDEPKIKMEGLKEEIRVTKSKLLNQATIAKKAKDSIPDAFNEAAKSHHRSVIANAQVRTSELNRMMVMLQGNRTTLISMYGDCFTPVPKPDQLKVVTQMCQNWNGTRAEAPPDCCNQKGKCTVVQLEGISKMLTSRILAHKTKEKKFVGMEELALEKGRDSIEEGKYAAVKEERVLNMRDIKESEHKKKLANEGIAAARGEPAKQVVKAPSFEELRELADANTRLEGVRDETQTEYR